MTKQMREITQAIYELTLNPTATPSNWENLAEDVQSMIRLCDEEYLYKLYGQNKKFSLAVHDPDERIDIESSMVENVQHAK